MSAPTHRIAARGQQRGVSLIELMIALVIGLLVVAAAGSMFISNSVTYRATQSLGRMQESARMAFEIMARDVRKAGGNPCARGLPVANTLNSPSSYWYADWSQPVFGYDNGGLAGTVTGSDAIEIKTGDDVGVSVVSHTATSANFEVNTPDHGFEVNDILMVCDYRQAAIFQMSGPASGGAGSAQRVVHATGSGTPGNCTKGLGYKPVMDCSTNGTPYTYGPNSVVVKLYAARWYVAANGRGGRSLYRTTSRNPGGAEEVTDGVQDMQIDYLVQGAPSYVAAGTVTTAGQWQQVVAVRITLTLQGGERVGTDGNVLERRLTHTVTLRNRLS
jgi:type IV pilus assembly protein PilW